MENLRNYTLTRQSEDLFRFYDRQRIGLITKRALLFYLGLVDRLITEQWLSKILISHGFTLGEYINCQEFVKIMDILSSFPEQDGYETEEK